MSVAAKPQTLCRSRTNVDLTNAIRAARDTTLPAGAAYVFRASQPGTTPPLCRRRYPCFARSLPPSLSLSLSLSFSLSLSLSLPLYVCMYIYIDIISIGAWSWSIAASMPLLLLLLVPPPLSLSFAPTPTSPLSHSCPLPPPPSPLSPSFGPPPAPSLPPSLSLHRTLELVERFDSIRCCYPCILV